MQEAIQKGDLMRNLPGCKVWATNDSDLAIMEWDQEESGELAYQIQRLLRRHALSTNFMDRLSRASLVVRQLELLPLAVVAKSAAAETALEFYGSAGGRLDPADLNEVPGAKPTRLDMITDTATHAARSLRAYVHSDVELRLSFGIGPDGQCLLAVINPLECHLGSATTADLITKLGGARK